MSVFKSSRLLQATWLLVALTALSACGFHLRDDVTLPASMQRLHLSVNGGGELGRQLTRALVTSGATVVDESAPGVAELRIPTARFSTESLTAGGYVRITEVSVRYHVEFDVVDANGLTLLPTQRIDMSREYSYDAADAIGNSSQVRELQKSLNDDMVQAILFRLQAADEQQSAEPATASSAR